MNNFSRFIFGYLKKIKKRQWLLQGNNEKTLRGKKNRKDFFGERKKFYDANFWNIQVVFQKIHFSS